VAEKRDPGANGQWRQLDHKPVELLRERAGQRAAVDQPDAASRLALESANPGTRFVRDDLDTGVRVLLKGPRDDEVAQVAYIAFVANAFALLGLRALFFLVKGLLDRLVYLSTGLALILAFIGVKLILHWAHEDISSAVPEISTPLSLAVIGVVLAVVTIASLVKTRRDPTATAHAGSLRARRTDAEAESG
jgi:hypothetical protein